jgi:hypothetical protein
MTIIVIFGERLYQPPVPLLGLGELGAELGDLLLGLGRSFLNPAV